MTNDSILEEIARRVRLPHNKDLSRIRMDTFEEFNKIINDCFGAPNNYPSISSYNRNNYPSFNSPFIHLDKHLVFDSVVQDLDKDSIKLSFTGIHSNEDEYNIASTIQTDREDHSNKGLILRMDCIPIYAPLIGKDNRVKGFYFSTSDTPTNASKNRIERFYLVEE